MLITAAMVTPGPDVISQLILFAAIYPLYEISILLVRATERKREAELRAQGLWDDEAETRQGKLMTDDERRAGADRRGARAPEPAAAAGARPRRRRRLRLDDRPRPAGAGAAGRRASTIGLLVGVDRARDTLLANTRQFARGFPANNVLLWGARGMGKSSLVKAAHAEAAREAPGRLKLIELHREDLPSIGRLLGAAARLGPAVPAVLRRPQLRQGRQPLQVPEGGARRRDRRPARQRRALRHLEPAAPDAARDDRERAPDRGEPLARRPRRRCRSPTASACGSASTPARRTTSSA